MAVNNYNPIKKKYIHYILFISSIIDIIEY